jgi:biopolymer transport protein TolQ
MVDTSSGKILAVGMETVHKTHGVWDLFWQADFFVKLIMIVLLLSSFLSWAIIIGKMKQLLPLLKASKLSGGEMEDASTLGQFSENIKKTKEGPLHRIFETVVKEIKRGGTKEEKLSHIDRLMQSGIKKEMDGLEKNIGFLATIGSVTPFVGLLGTVWGIMNSFQSITLSKNTSLDVVAPGIAEALAATALGLLAAIPAVIAYNQISIFLNHYATRLETSCDHLYGICARGGDR